MPSYNPKLSSEENQKRKDKYNVNYNTRRKNKEYEHQKVEQLCKCGCGTTWTNAHAHNRHLKDRGKQVNGSVAQLSWRLLLAKGEKTCPMKGCKQNGHIYDHAKNLGVHVRKYHATSDLNRQLYNLQAEAAAIALNIKV